MGATQTATVNVAVASGGTATGTVALSTRARSLHGGRAATAAGTATGTVNLQTGEFHLSGTYNDGSDTAFRLDGILPSSANISNIALTLGGSTFSGSLTATGGSPIPTPSSPPASSPSPGISPSPVPSPTPIGVSGTTDLAKYFPLHTGDVYRYKHQNGDTSPDDVIRTGSATDFLGKTAYPLEYLDATTGQPTSSDRDFVNNTSEGFVVYGYSEGAGGKQVGYNPASVIPAKVLRGETATFSFQENSGDYTYTYSGTITPQGQATISVPAGVFNVFKIMVKTTQKTKNNATGETFTDVDEETDYLAENVGLVRSSDRYQKPDGTYESESVNELKSATVNGKQYP